MVIEEQPKAAYLLGQISDRGWWYYFPIALALKTSLPLLILAVVGLVRAVKDGGWGKTAVLWLPPLLFMLLAMTGRITIGYRHILPVVPFLIMLAAQVGRMPWPVFRIPYSVFRVPFLGSRLTAHGLRLTDYGSRITAHGSRITEYGLRTLLFALLLWHVVGTVRLWPHQEAFLMRWRAGRKTAVPSW
jgi:hypothetical protein